MAATSQRPRGSEYGAGNGDYGSQHKRPGDEEQAGERDVRVGVSNSVEDRMVIEQELEAADIHMQCQDEQQNAEP